MRTLITAGVGVVVAIFLVFLVGALFSWDAPAVNEIGLHYSGGPLEGQHFEGTIDPGSSGRFMGFADKMVKLPANQRTYIVSERASEGDGGSNDAIVAKNDEGVEIRYQTTMWFELNTDPKVLRDFYEDICTKYDDCYDKEGTTDDGWGQMLNDNLRKAQETALQYESRNASTDDLMQDADALAGIQENVADSLQTKVNDNLGGPYFTDMRFQINQVGVPTEVAAGYNKIKAAELLTETRRQEVEQAEQQNLAAQKLQETLKDNPNYIKLQYIEALKDGVERGGIKFWVLPSDSELVAPAPEE